MIAVVVRQKIRPRHLDEYLRLMLEHARRSVSEEPGCLRFDVLQAEDDPTEVWLYELYRDGAAVEAHGGTERFARVVGSIKDWFDEPERVLRSAPLLLTEDARGS
jgi:autoinducer 2-degrading protein